MLERSIFASKTSFNPISIYYNIMSKFRIKTIIAARGITLKTLAEMLEITPSILAA